MSSQSRKARGMRTQLLVADYWRPLFPHAKSAGAGRQGADILDTPGVSIEVKARREFDPLSAIRQAEANAAEQFPFVIMRPDGMGEQSQDDWLFVTSQRRGFDLVDMSGLWVTDWFWEADAETG